MSMSYTCRLSSSSIGSICSHGFCRVSTGFCALRGFSMEFRRLDRYAGNYSCRFICLFRAVVVHRVFILAVLVTCTKAAGSCPLNILSATSSLNPNSFRGAPYCKSLGGCQCYGLIFLVQLQPQIDLKMTWVTILAEKLGRAPATPATAPPAGPSASSCLLLAGECATLPRYRSCQGSSFLPGAPAARQGSSLPRPC